MSAEDDGKVGPVEVAAGSKTSSTVVICLCSWGRMPAKTVEDVSEGGIEAVDAIEVFAAAAAGN